MVLPWKTEKNDTKEIETFLKTDTDWNIKMGRDLFDECTMWIKYQRRIQEAKEVLPSSTLTHERDTVLNTPEFINHVVSFCVDQPQFEYSLLGVLHDAYVSTYEITTDRVKYEGVVIDFSEC